MSEPAHFLLINEVGHIVHTEDNYGHAVDAACNMVKSWPHTDVYVCEVSTKVSHSNGQTSIKPVPKH